MIQNNTKLHNKKHFSLKPFFWFCSCTLWSNPYLQPFKSSQSQNCVPDLLEKHGITGKEWASKIKKLNEV